jgi:hypothetical protein
MSSWQESDRIPDFSLDNPGLDCELLRVFRRGSRTLGEEDLAADPGRLELFWLLRRELNEEMLQEMAAGHGGMDQAVYYAGLRDILRTGNVDCVGSDFEICNILRWGMVDLSVPLTPEQRRRQVTRLFGSWILLNAYAHPERSHNGQIEAGDEVALQNLCEISVALGPEFVRAAIPFVMWVQSAGAVAHDPIDNLFYLLSLLVLRCASPDAGQIAAAPAVYDTLVAQERTLRQQLSEEKSESWTPELAWLFGLYRGDNDGLLKSESVQRKWVRTAVWVLDRLAASTSGEVDPRLVEFRHRLLHSLS